MSRRPAGSSFHPGSHGQRGISLIETLVAMALGLLVLAGVLQMMNQLVAGNTTTVSTVRLAQDTRTVMDMVIQDLRRAGQFPEAANDLGEPLRFLQDQPDPPRIDGEPLQAGKSGSAIAYAYREADGKLVQARFSRDAKTGTVQMHTGTSAAPESITDATAMNVTDLIFMPQAVIQNTGQIETAVVAIEVYIRAQLKSEPTVERELTDRVVLRNVVLKASR